MEIDLYEGLVDKAEQDVQAAFRLLRTCPVQVPDVICWHSQQCAEKYLKAFMAREPDLGFIRGHDLVRLNQECIKGDADFRELDDNLDKLYELGQPGVRYPGLVTDSVDAKTAFRIAMRVRRLVRRKLWNESMSF